MLTQTILHPINSASGQLVRPRQLLLTTLRPPTGPGPCGTSPVGGLFCGSGNRYYGRPPGGLEPSQKGGSIKLPEKFARQLYFQCFSELRAGSGFFSPLELGAAAPTLLEHLGCIVLATFRCPLPGVMATFAQNARRKLHYTDTPRLWPHELFCAHP